MISSIFQISHTSSKRYIFLWIWAPGRLFWLESVELKQTHGLYKFSRMQKGKEADRWLCLFLTYHVLAPLLAVWASQCLFLPWPSVLFSINRSRLSSSPSAGACPQSPSFASGISPPAPTQTIFPLLDSYSCSPALPPSSFKLLWAHAICLPYPVSGL